MTRIAIRIARFGMAGSVAALVALPAASATRPDQPVQAWPAMAGVDTATLLEQAQDLPVSDMAVGDQPYCAADAEIHQTLQQDFNETPVPGDGHAAIARIASTSGPGTLRPAPTSRRSSCASSSGSV